MKGPDSYIFNTIVRISFFVINVFAVYLVLRGHNLPGGGFIGGLATAISFLLLSLALGMQQLHSVVRFDPVQIAATGLMLAVLTGVAPMFAGRPFLEHFNFHLEVVPILGAVHLGTPLLFDIAVYLVVVGATCKIIFVLGKSTEGLRALVAEDQQRYSSPRETPIEEQPSEDQPFSRDKEEELFHAN